MKKNQTAAHAAVYRLARLEYEKKKKKKTKMNIYEEKSNCHKICRQ